MAKRLLALTLSILLVLSLSLPGLANGRHHTSPNGNSSTSGKGNNGHHNGNNGNSGKNNNNGNNSNNSNKGNSGKNNGSGRGSSPWGWSSGSGWGNNSGKGNNDKGSWTPGYNPKPGTKPVSPVDFNKIYVIKIHGEQARGSYSFYEAAGITAQNLASVSEITFSGEDGSGNAYSATLFSSGDKLSVKRNFISTYLSTPLNSPESAVSGTVTVRWSNGTRTLLSVASQSSRGWNCSSVLNLWVTEVVEKPGPTEPAESYVTVNNLFNLPVEGVTALPAGVTFTYELRDLAGTLAGVGSYTTKGTEKDLSSVPVKIELYENRINTSYEYRITQSVSDDSGWQLSQAKYFVVFKSVEGGVAVKLIGNAETFAQSDANFVNSYIGLVEESPLFAEICFNLPVEEANAVPAGVTFTFELRDAADTLAGVGSYTTKGTEKDLIAIPVEIALYENRINTSYEYFLTQSVSAREGWEFSGQTYSVAFETVKGKLGVLQIIDADTFYASAPLFVNSYYGPLDAAKTYAFTCFNLPVEGVDALPAGVTFTFEIWGYSDSTESDTLVGEGSYTTTGREVDLAVIPVELELYHQLINPAYEYRMVQTDGDPAGWEVSAQQYIVVFEAVAGGVGILMTIDSETFFTSDPLFVNTYFGE